MGGALSPGKLSGMKLVLMALVLLFAATISASEQQPVHPQFDVQSAERFANLALACVHKEYPNKIAHSLNSDADVAPPRKLTPALYGCYDWHSSVHGHWLLVRIAYRAENMFQYGRPPRPPI